MLKSSINYSMITIIIDAQLKYSCKGTLHAEKNLLIFNTICLGEDKKILH